MGVPGVGLGQLRWAAGAARGSKPSAAGTGPADLGMPEHSFLTGSAGVMAMTRPSPSSPDQTPLPGQPTSSLDDLPPSEKLGPGNRPAAVPRALSLAFPLVLKQNSFRTISTLFQLNPRNCPRLGHRSWAVSVCQTPVWWQEVSQSERVPGGKRQDMVPGTLPASPRPLGPARPRATHLLTWPWTYPPVSTLSAILDIL